MRDRATLDDRDEPFRLGHVFGNLTGTQRQRIAAAIGMPVSQLARLKVHNLAPWVKRRIANELDTPVTELFPS